MSIEQDAARWNALRQAAVEEDEEFLDSLATIQARLETEDSFLAMSRADQADFVIDLAIKEKAQR
jgi:hypothetical protein